MIVDNAIYVDGHRASEPRSLRETYEALRKARGVAWIGLYRPTEEEFASVAEEFELHELAVEDALEAHQRPKLERYGQTLFVVLRPARYLDDPEEVEVFSGNPGVSRRTYELSREVIEFQRAVKPLSGMLASLIAGFEKYKVNPELQRYLRDVQDHTIEVNELVSGFKDLLQNI